MKLPFYRNTDKCLDDDMISKMFQLFYDVTLQTERHFIMQVVCEATQATDVQVKVAALQCLVKIMSLYYQFMESYMGPALFAITLEAMKSEIDEVCRNPWVFCSKLIIGYLLSKRKITVTVTLSLYYGRV
jgi:hypothetical protein